MPRRPLPPSWAAASIRTRIGVRSAPARLIEELEAALQPSGAVDGGGPAAPSR